MIANTELDTDQKVLNIQKEVEEATALELPMLEKNLVFLSTIASVATLLGLFGTVIGMIRSFSALGESGGGEAAQKLSQGISEALYNTALVLVLLLLLSSCIMFLLQELMDYLWY